MEFANYGVVVSGALLKNQRENVRRFLLALTEGIQVYKTKPDLARGVLRESNSDAEIIGPLYERLSKSVRDYPAPEPRGIQNVLDSLPTPKARGARGEEFTDSSLMDEIKKAALSTGCMEKLVKIHGVNRQKTTLSDMVPSKRRYGAGPALCRSLGTSHHQQGRRADERPHCGSRSVPAGRI